MFGHFFLFLIYSGELGRFVADKRCLKSLKMEGCSSLGSFSLCSSSLSTLWLSDLCSLSKMVISLFLVSLTMATSVGVESLLIHLLF